MASAGQAQAHSSQPMHFSRPSGQRLSWWCPWNRGAVGRLSSGYITVSTFLNISRKVTPNPLTGLRKSSTGDLLRHAIAGCRGRGPGGCRHGPGQRRAAQLKAVVVRQVTRRHREPRHRLLDLDQLAVLVVVPLVLFLGRNFRGYPGQVLLVAVVPERDHQEEEDEDHAPDRVHGGVVPGAGVEL